MIKFLAVVSLCALDLAGQFPGGGLATTTLRGRVQTDEIVVEPYNVELRSASDPMGTHRGFTNSTGEFTIQGIAEGDYQLTISDRLGRPILERLVHVDSSGIPIEVRLPSKPAGATPPGSVSFASLSHKVPRKAQRAFDAAENARKHGDEDAWSKHLREALAIDPQFTPAHNDLGTYYMRHEMFDLALAELDEAAALDSGAAQVQINRAGCLAQMGRLHEAEVAARRAVRLNGGSSRARYTLGLVLANLRKLPAEAVDNLVGASDAFPGARLVAAQILLNSGHRSDAREQLRRYLQTCSGENCKSVQSSLDRLNSTR